MKTSLCRWFTYALSGECGGKCIEGQLCGMARCLGQSANGAYQIFSAESARFLGGFAQRHLRQRRPASHRRDAALGLELDCDDPARVELHADTNDVSAHRILNLYGGVCVGQISRVARVLEVIEELRGIHRLSPAGSVWKIDGPSTLVRRGL